MKQKLKKSVQIRINLIKMMYKKPEEITWLPILFINNPAHLSGTGHFPHVLHLIYIYQPPPAKMLIDWPSVFPCHYF